MKLTIEYEDYRLEADSELLTPDEQRNLFALLGKLELRKQLAEKKGNNGRQNHRKEST